MKPEELMLGDIVTFKDCQNDKEPVIIKIWSINQDGESFAFIDGDESLDEIVIDDEIVGLPLTPEILEKNGFENGKLNISPQYYLEDKDVFIGVTLKDIPDKHKGIDIAKGRLYFQLDISRMEEPLYVHQLQQALKLCGIDKTIEL